MGSLIKKEDNQLVTILHQNSNEISKPFEKEVYLLTSYIAGTRYIPGIEEIADELEIDEELKLYRDIKNEYDPKAIMVKTKNGTKLGFIPRHNNAVISRLMDAGKIIYAKVKNIYNHEYIDAAKIDIDIYLKD